MIRVTLHLLLACNALAIPREGNAFLQKRADSGLLSIYVSSHDPITHLHLTAVLSKHRFSWIPNYRGTAGFVFDREYPNLLRVLDKEVPPKQFNLDIAGHREPTTAVLPYKLVRLFVPAPKFTPGSTVELPVNVQRCVAEFTTSKAKATWIVESVRYRERNYLASPSRHTTGTDVIVFSNGMYYYYSILDNGKRIWYAGWSVIRPA